MNALLVLKFNTIKQKTGIEKKWQPIKESVSISKGRNYSLNCIPLYTSIRPIHMYFFQNDLNCILKSFRSQNIDFNNSDPLNLKSRVSINFAAFSIVSRNVCMLSDEMYYKMYT